MARKFAVNINLDNNQVVNFKPEILASDPGTPQEGRTYYNSVSKELRFWNGSAWVAVPGSSGLTDPLTFKGVIDASTNPNYPAADAGDVYFISVAGLIGGGSGVAVDVGDMLICNTDASAGGTHASVGAEWNIVQSNVFPASTTVAGYVELATVAETEGKADASRAVTSAGLATFTRRYTTDISASTGATITAATHGLGATKALSVDIYEDGAPNTPIIADFSVADNGDVTWATTAAISGHIVIIG